MVTHEEFRRGGVLPGLGALPPAGGHVVWRRRPWREAALRALDIRWQWEHISRAVNAAFRVTIDQPMRWALRWPEPAQETPMEPTAVSPGMELLAARMAAAMGPCAHSDAVPVRTARLDAELVAWLCPGCDTQLPAGWTTE